MNPRCSTPAVGDSASQVIGSFSPVDESAAPVHQEQLVAEETTHNTTDIHIPSSTSTSSDRREVLTNMLNWCIEQLSLLAAVFESIEKETEKTALLAKWTKEPEQVPWKRHRRTRYIPLPEIMENATYLVPLRGYDVRVCFSLAHLRGCSRRSAHLSCTWRSRLLCFCALRDTRPAL